MNVVFATTLDDAYLPGFLVTVNTLLKSTENFNFPICVIEWGNLSNESKQSIWNLYPDVIFHRVDLTEYNQKFDSTHRTWNYNCNVRYDVFALDGFDRVIYFDTDIIFQIDARHLLEFDVDFGACLMPNIKFFEQVESDKIFNAGLMSIGKKFLNKKTKLDLLNLANSKPPLIKLHTNNWVGNQPILNNFFANDLFAIPDRFNFLVDRFDTNTLKDSILKNFHFIGHEKPWISNSNLTKAIAPYVLDCVTKNCKDNIILARIALKNLLSLYQKSVSNLLEEKPEFSKYF